MSAFVHAAIMHVFCHEAHHYAANNVANFVLEYVHKVGRDELRTPYGHGFRRIAEIREGAKVGKIRSRLEKGAKGDS